MISIPLDHQILYLVLCLWISMFQCLYSLYFSMNRTWINLHPVWKLYKSAMLNSFIVGGILRSTFVSIQSPYWFLRFDIEISTKNFYLLKIIVIYNCVTLLCNFKFLVNVLSYFNNINFLNKRRKDNQFSCLFKRCFGKINTSVHHMYTTKSLAIFKKWMTTITELSKKAIAVKCF